MMRMIDQRKAMVAGLDLEQALNYILIQDVSEEFIHEKYTADTRFYRRGSRVELEKIVDRVTADAPDTLTALRRLNAWLVEKVPHAVNYMQATGRRLPADRNLREEDVIASGVGWCNEQSRLFCALSQIYGVTSRLVFLFMPPGEYGGGHVICEVLLDGQWLAVDPTFGYFFVTPDGKNVAASRVYHQYRDVFAADYRQVLQSTAENYRRDVIESCAELVLAQEPLRAFIHTGYYNYFVY